MAFIKSQKLQLFYILGLIILWCSCRKDFDYQPSSGNLSFSKDTVYLDTVFTNIGSSTHSLKVYNRSNTDIQIPSITFKNGLNSKYRINVDGQAGQEFYNIPLLANDSLYIFIETTFEISSIGESEFLYTDEILFDSSSNQQSVSLVTLIKDAIFLYPKKDANGIYENISLRNSTGVNIMVNGFTLNDSQLNFTNEKPYIIYGYAAIPENKTLIIDAGARIYFHQNSGLFAKANSTLLINGSLSSDQLALENEVIFEGDRLEPEFNAISGQWGSIWFDKESTDNQINHLTIKNATVGLFVNGTNSKDTINLKITNSQIYNSSSINLWNNNSHVIGSNLVLGNAGYTSLFCNNGGYYRFIHTTIANYWTSGFRSGAALQIDNDTIENVNLNKAEFINCIIDGNNLTELFLTNTNNTKIFNYSFVNCMIKISLNTSISENPLYDFENLENYNSVFFNENSDFSNPKQNDFSIKENSFAIGKANLDGAILVPKDILDNDRTETPDIGTYQFFPTKN
tara:strand:- start:6107 stop:7645 length:1539 start_codon:yes stop_codon:yes gene_type:complete